MSVAAGVRGYLYQKGKLTSYAARNLTGDGRRRLEAKIAEYGFSLLGTAPNDAATELTAAEETPRG